MPVCVINLLEVIDVHQHQGDERAISHMATHFQVDLLIKEGMVEEACQTRAKAARLFLQYALRQPA